MKFKIIPNEQTPECTDRIDLDDDRKLMEKFLSFARRQHNCVGLASNQVSCDGVRIMKPFFALKDQHFWTIIIDPVIKEYKGKHEQKIERCLTWIGKDLIVDRFPEIEVIYYTLATGTVHETISGFEAQIWQHEYNHLKGIEEKIV